MNRYVRAAVRPLRVVVGLSGGVDSSVAALLLRDAGFEVHCVFMRNWDSGDEAGAGLDREPCPIEVDYASARSVASVLSLPLTRLDLSRQSWTDVFEPWLGAYATGRTPNPDAACNRFIKFGAFRAHALGALGGDLLATGHWASVWPPVTSPDRASLPPEHADEGAPPPRLLGGVDGLKDQSDFLSTVPRTALRRVLFPLGRHTKEQARALAAAAGLPTASRKDSTGMCFVGKRKLGPFLRSYLPAPPPARLVRVDTGAVVGGPCDAPEALTPGQRARVSGQGMPLYVVRVDLGRSMVVVAPGEHHASLYCTSAAVRLAECDLLPPQLQGSARPSVDEAAAWLRMGGPLSCAPSLHVMWRDRHRAEDLRGAHAAVMARSVWESAVRRGCAPGRVRDVEAGGEEDMLVLRFEEPARGVAPGQVLVVYGREAVGEGADTLPLGPGPGCGTARPWNGAGLPVLAAGPIQAAGPSLWEAA
jgi:tRNA (5-methylaminomethyl-2-thiouridylate)-methyltransferase